MILKIWVPSFLCYESTDQVTTVLCVWKNPKAYLYKNFVIHEKLHCVARTFESSQAMWRCFRIALNGRGI